MKIKKKNQATNCELSKFFKKILKVLFWNTILFIYKQEESHRFKLKSAVSICEISAYSKYLVFNLFLVIYLKKRKNMENLTNANTLTSMHQLLAAAAAAVSSAAGTPNGRRMLERTQSEPLPRQANTSRYKTELCRPFEESGECKYGEKCQFAHGYHELRNLQRHPKYKTELCRTFHSVGFCPYGPRCHFVHNADEAAPHTTIQTQQSQQHLSRFNPQQQYRRFYWWINKSFMK